MFLPQLFQFGFILGCGRPNTILNGLVDIIVICASDNETNFALRLCVTICIDVLQVREGLNNGVKIVRVFGFKIRPSLIDGGHDFIGVIIGVHGNLNVNKWNDK